MCDNSTPSLGEIRACARPEDRIVVLGCAPQIYLFLRRGMSGLRLDLFCVQRRRTMDRISTRPPALLVAPTALTHPPELANYVSSVYTERVYGRRDWSLRAAPGARPGERCRDLVPRSDAGAIAR
jgi:hypothetical protein